jgi:hypothetical protein
MAAIERFVRRRVVCEVVRQGHRLDCRRHVDVLSGPVPLVRMSRNAHDL